MTMIIALASPRVAASAEECLERIERSISEAAARGAEIVCFPEEGAPNRCLPKGEATVSTERAAGSDCALSSEASTGISSETRKGMI
jgi:predicted amidohydrolase